jgi:hypothetical protein
VYGPIVLNRIASLKQANLLFRHVSDEVRKCLMILTHSSHMSCKNPSSPTLLTKKLELNCLLELSIKVYGPFVFIRFAGLKQASLFIIHISDKERKCLMILTSSSHMSYKNPSSPTLLTKS